MNTQRPLKLYLDTSVISHVDAPLKPREEAATLAFFRFVEQHTDEFELYVSPVAVVELDACPEPKRIHLLRFLAGLKCDRLQESLHVSSLVHIYLEEKVLGVQHVNDLTHIAYAVVADCDFIVSWNFKHFVNTKTPPRVNAANARHGYRSIMILSPTALLEALNNDSA